MQDKIMQDLKAAMLAGEKDKVEVLRMVKTALQMAAIDNRDNFDEAAQMKIIAKESKKRKDAAQMYLDGNEQERADKELAEAKIIDAYLPAQMDEAKISSIVDSVIADIGPGNMGAIMGRVMQEVAGKADGGIVSRIVKEKMQG
jgi:uncharacterized protein YqeY